MRIVLIVFAFLLLDEARGRNAPGRESVERLKLPERDRMTSARKDLNAKLMPHKVGQLEAKGAGGAGSRTSPVVLHFNKAVDTLFSKFKFVFKNGEFLLEGPIKPSNFDVLRHGQTSFTDELRFLESMSIRWDSIVPEQELDKKNTMVLLGYGDITRVGDIKGTQLENKYEIRIPFKIGPVSVLPKSNLNQEPKMKYFQNGEVTVAVEKQQNSEPHFLIESLHLNKLNYGELSFDSTFDQQTHNILHDQVEELIVRLNVVSFANSLLEKLMTTPDIVQAFKGKEKKS